MVREFDDESLPIDAVHRDWGMFIVEEPDNTHYSIIDRNHHVLFTWDRAPSLGEVLEKSEELIKEEVL